MSLLLKARFLHVQFVDELGGVVEGLTIPELGGVAGQAVVALKPTKMRIDDLNWEGRIAPGEPPLANRVNENTFIAAAVAHELQHNFAAGDLNHAGHMRDTDGNGVEAEPSDRELVLWDYDFPMNTLRKTVAVAADNGATEITLNNVDGLADIGRMSFDDDTIELDYTRIDKTQKKLKGVRWLGIDNLQRNAPLDPKRYDLECRKIWYGIGLIKITKVR